MNPNTAQSGPALNRRPIAAPSSSPDAGASDLARASGGGRSLLGRALAVLAFDRTALLGFVLFFAIVAAALLAPVLAPHDPNLISMRDRFRGPSLTYPLGTDELGRDLLSRLMYGARVSMSVGVISVGLAATVGSLLGLIGGYYGGRIDTAIMRMMDGLLAFPAIILALAIMTALGPSLVNAMIAIGIVSIPSFARLLRSSVLALKEREFVEAVRASGATGGYLMFRTILPNCLSPLLVQVTVGFANAVLAEAALSFLGLGVRPPTPSWGAMLDMGRRFLTQTGWYSTTAGAAVFIAVLSLNLLGDGLRDALDPRLQHQRERA
ncbi:MAG: peptide/nickel transport system permease protein [Thermomicrobiales bacterium]|nr:peptide/nickel transport system permease protein [Thermomicrobiales bacterium]